MLVDLNIIHNKLKLEKNMKRLALLIGSPSHPETPKAGKFLEGVETDIKNIYGFLSSSIGGSWKQDEIKTFSENPSYDEVLPYLKACQDVDFAFVYFSGHGYTDNNDVTRVNFNETETPEVIKHLANRAKRQITIIDACRSFPQFIGFDGSILLEGISFPNPKPEFARALFDNYTSRLPSTRVLLCATSKGHASMDYGKNQGGIFSSSLLSVVKDKLENENKPVFTVAEIFKKAKINTQKNEPKQRPEIFINDEAAFRLPFAVNPNYKLQQLKKFDQFVNENKTEDIAKGLLVGAGIVLTGIIIGSLLSKNK